MTHVFLCWRFVCNTETNLPSGAATSPYYSLHSVTTPVIDVEMDFVKHYSSCGKCAIVLTPWGRVHLEKVTGF